MKHLTVGIIAHVDSGKTTLSEAILYLSGSIRSFGRVDKGDSFLDSDRLERRRGITIFSKQARFTRGDTSFVLIDTPGHTDFSAETERSLRILDCAVLLISAPDGIRAQTHILWDLLETYHVPTFLFFNKMDQYAGERPALSDAAKDLTGGAAADFSSASLSGDSAAAAFPPDTLEEIAMCGEDAMEEYLAAGSVSEDLIRKMIAERKLIPCFFGSALKMDGVEQLLSGIERYVRFRRKSEDLSAVVYKITHAPDGQRLTFLKVTGGSLAARDLLPDGGEQSKVTQIRYYSGEKYTTAESAEAGDICAVCGLRESFAGQGFGREEDSLPPRLSPVLSYRVLPEEGVDAVSILPRFRLLEEESPELSVTWDEERQCILVYVMGQVQLEILTAVLAERFGLHVRFDEGEVMYRETICAPVVGVGHYEPLRHYAEVHLLMEPLPRGSGLIFARDLSTDRLAEHWQRLIMTHLAERRHIGVLTGSPVTDMKITLTAGKAHLKHTEGGDFRQAVYRAVRQGLMSAESVLLEPWYRFSLDIPASSAGRALHDLDRMHASFLPPETDRTGERAVIAGRGPVAGLRGYPAELAAYTRGTGSISLVPDGYEPCHDAEEVIRRKGYDPGQDLRNPADSVFCTHGAGHLVPWDEVYEHMHLPFEGREKQAGGPVQQRPAEREVFLEPEEIDAIIASFSRANSRPQKGAPGWKKLRKAGGGRPAAGSVPKLKVSHAAVPAFPLKDADVLLVDGYNVIFAWEDLSAVADEDIGAARDALCAVLSKYRSMVSSEVIAVFDAWRVPGRARETLETERVQIVYTAEDETADRYIERYTNEKGRKLRAAVVTSDTAERFITGGQGCMLVSSADFRSYLEGMTRDFNERYGVEEST